MGDVCGINRKDYEDGKGSIPQGYIYETLRVQPCHLIAPPQGYIYATLRVQPCHLVAPPVFTFMRRYVYNLATL